MPVSFLRMPIGRKANPEQNGELEELQFIPVSEALQLPIIDVTELMLEHLEDIWHRRTAGRPLHPLPPRPPIGQLRARELSGRK